MTKKTLLAFFLLFFLLPACNSRSSEPPPPGSQSIALERVFPALIFTEPVELVQRPGDDERWYLLERGGAVLTFTGQGESASVAADLNGRIDSEPMEGGLLGIAFHPQFEENAALFLSYTAPATAPGVAIVSRISRFISPDGGLTIDPESEQILLTLDQPRGNHNGGQIMFGPDGYLYIGFGDGGGAGDPFEHGQNPETLFGAILRIDIDASSNDRPYGIPADNPFVEGGGAPEVYAWGLRNPWRFSFDQQTGVLWAADVGQNHWEEVNIIQRGGNYGWNIREGAHCFPPHVQDCPTEGLIDPVTEYPNAAGDCSITGGYVYRGEAIPALRGNYLFGDFCSGKIWALPLGDDGTPAAGHHLLLESNERISSFGQGNDAEVYLLDFTGGGIYRLVPSP
jgi:glucose/arabinose dehydrogenase